MKKKIFLLSMTLVIVFIMTGCFGLYTKEDIEKAYEQGLRDAGAENKNNTEYGHDGYQDDYDLIAEQGDFENINDYRGTFKAEKYVFITPTGSCYHKIDCATLNDTEYVKAYLPGTVPEGYEPCSKCNPY